MQLILSQFAHCIGLQNPSEVYPETKRGVAAWHTVFSLDRIGTYFSEKFVTTRSNGISSVPTLQIMPTRSTAVPTRSATA